MKENIHDLVSALSGHGRRFCHVTFVSSLGSPRLWDLLSTVTLTEITHLF